MVFISYAQNFEDVILNRVLSDVEKGFYIDVGAWLPEIDSVTKSFYDAGWNGINVEPNQTNCQAFTTSRPRDQNLQLAIGDFDGNIKINFISKPNFLDGSASGLSTTDAIIASQHLDNGWSIEEEEVAQIRLSTLWKNFVNPDQPVHFLKVDVEGAEVSVLESNDWKLNRPWIVVFEATKPLSQESSDSKCDEILLQNEYHLLYQDGLNHFYLASEHLHLSDKFLFPPNVFDNFVKNSELMAQVKLNELIVCMQTLEEKLRNIQSMVSKAIEH